MAGFGRCFTRNRGTTGRLIRLRPTSWVTHTRTWEALVSWPIRGLSLGRQWRMSNLRVWLERGRRELKHRHGSQGQVRCTGSVVVLTRQRRLPFLHVLPTLVEDLLDIVGRSYDGVDYVVLRRHT